MQWINLPEIEPGTSREHFSAYCWNCQRDKFIPGIPLTHQLYLNPFIHTEPICEECAKSYDPHFGHGTKLRLMDGKIHITKGDESECPHPDKKSYYSVWPSRKIVIACSQECAEEMVGIEKEDWESFCKEIGLSQLKEEPW